MKDSILTSNEIFNRMNSLQKELDEIGKALNEIDDSVGQDSLPWNLLNKAYKEKSDEWNQFRKLEWRLN
jgi:archaellum component FlaC